MLNKSIKKIYENDRLELLDYFSENNDLDNFKLFFSYRTNSTKYIDNFRKHYNIDAVKFILIYSQIVIKNIHNLYLEKFDLINYNKTSYDEINEIVSVIVLHHKWRFYVVAKLLNEKHKVDIDNLCLLLDKKHNMEGINFMLRNFKIKKNTFINTFYYEVKRTNQHPQYFCNLICFLSNVDFDTVPMTIIDFLIKSSINSLTQLEIIIEKTNIGINKIINFVIDHGTFDILEQLCKKYKVDDVEYLVDNIIRKPSYKSIEWLINNFVFDKNKLCECVYKQPCVNDINIIQLLNNHIKINYNSLSELTTDFKVYTYLMKYNVNNIDNVNNVSYEMYLECAKTNNFTFFVDLYEKKPIDLSNDEILKLFMGHQNLKAVKWIILQNIHKS